MQPVRRGDVWWVSFDIVVSNNAANRALDRVVGEAILLHLSFRRM